MTRQFNPPHPGGILADELAYRNLSCRAFALQSGIPEDSVAQILREAAPITSETAQRIATALGGPEADTWLDMQRDYDEWQASHPQKHTEA